MKNSTQLFADAQAVIPGGVNSPVRAFRGVGGTPVFFQKAQGAYLYDVESKRYIDYVGSWGPMICGHAHPDVVDAVTRAAKKSLSFGAPTEGETELANLLCRLMPSIEKVRLVNSGTEAVMSAIRLARGFTGRHKIIKFSGCYHGHVDALLVKSGSGALTLGVPDSAGIPASVTQDTISLDYNNLAQVEETFSAIGSEIAAVIVEPVAGNMNCVPPKSGFLEGLRKLCDQAGSVLIFDEVMTGFRVALGGAQAVYNIKPDLTTLGKVIGGGMPVGAFGGRAEIMNCLAPDGPVYQAGTLSGNPIAVAAGLATLKIIQEAGFYENLADKAEYLMKGLADAASLNGINLVTHQLGGMFGCFFTNDAKIESYEQVMKCDVARFQQFFHAMLDRGIYFAPSAFEAGFISMAHSNDDLEQTIAAATQFFVSI